MHGDHHRTWLPQIIGHRGASAIAPENTRPAFERALADGADGLELDLQLTRDDVVVVFHDHKLAKLGPQTRRMRDYTWPELVWRDAGIWKDARYKGTSLMTLEEVLASWAGTTQLLLEIKAHGRNRRGSHDRLLAEHVAQLLLTLSDERLAKIKVLSFSDDVLTSLSQFCQAAGRPVPQLVRNLVNPSELRKVTRLQMAHYSAMCVDINAFGPEDVARIHRADLPLYAYTVDSWQQIQHARALSCCLLIANDPGQVRERVAALAADKRATA
nr:hypothetical protein [Oceanococcus sp. HetDA_MAG_MS8]